MNALLDRLFPAGHTVAFDGHNLAGHAESAAGRVHVIGTRDRAALTTDMALKLSQAVLDAVRADQVSGDPRPIVFIASTQGQALSRHEELLGLNAVEIGGLLMKSWELPAALVDDVNDMGRLLVTPPAAIEPERLPRIALGYLCAHLGEGLAQGRIPSPEALTIGDAVDTHHLRACLAHPLLARLPAALQSPELQAAVRQMLGEPAEA